LVFPEPENFVRFVVEQIRKIWIDENLTVRSFAFGNKGHKGYYLALSRLCIYRGLPSINR
jgi:hypothetical protein